MLAAVYSKPGSNAVEKFTMNHLGSEESIHSALGAPRGHGHRRNLDGHVIEDDRG